MIQLPIDFEAPSNGTATSNAAARRVSRQTLGSQRQRLLNLLAAHPWGMTCDEMEQVTELKHQTCSARVRDLVKGGLVFFHGTRPTRSGCMARVYLLKRSDA